MIIFYGFDFCFFFMSSDVFWNICVHLLTERTSVMGIPDRGILFGFAFLVFCWFQFPYLEAAREVVVKVRWLKKKCSDIKVSWFCFFQSATKQLYEWFSPSFCLSIHMAVRLSHLFSCDQAALWMVQSVRLSFRHTFLTMFGSSYHHEFSRVITSDISDVLAKG